MSGLIPEIRGPEDPTRIFVTPVAVNNTWRHRCASWTHGQTGHECRCVCGTNRQGSKQ